MREYIPRLQEAIASAMRGLTREELLRERQGKWNIAYLLEHLYLTYTGTVKGCKLTLASPKPLATPQTVKQRIKTMAIIGLGYFPSGIEAPRQVRPKGIPVDQVISDIQREIAAICALRATIWKTEKVVQSFNTRRVEWRSVAQIALAPRTPPCPPDSRVTEAIRSKRKSPCRSRGLSERNLFTASFAEFFL